jgi:D-alanyl-D-alanine carboxypeptidase (penicillin-binding protein 5/6)
MKYVTQIFFVFLFSVLVTGHCWSTSYIIVDNETGCILEEKDRDQKNSTASLAQIALEMTLLDWSKLSKTSLDTLVTVPAPAPDQGRANPLGLQVGDRLTLRDLLYLSVLTSDAEAALTIATAVGSRLPNLQGLEPVGNFVSQMNALAAKLQMKSTLFLNPSGLDELPSQTQPYSTSADLARLVRYAYSKPGLLFYTAQPSREIQVQRNGKLFKRSVRNANTLLTIDRIDGVKVGHTEQAKGCIALTSEDRPEVKKEGDTIYTAPRRVIVIALGSPEPFHEGLGLMRHGWQLYQEWASSGRPTERHRFL